VRFTDEITKTGELGYDGRGFRKKIVVFPGKTLNNELSGNVIDLCPVGALLSKDTLHEERVWYWKFTDTICPLCSNGCNITVGVDPRKGHVARVRPRVNLNVNDYWICDRGRYEFRKVQDENRLREPLIRDGKSFQISSWDEILDLLSTEIIRSKNDPSSFILFIASPILTNEEQYLLKKLTEILSIDKPVTRDTHSYQEKKYGLISQDPFPNSRGSSEVSLSLDRARLDVTINSLYEEKIKALYVVGEDLFSIVKKNERTKLREALSKLTFLAVQDYKLTETAKLANIIIPGASPYEKDGTFTNDAGRVQRIKKAISPPGNAKPDWEILSLLGRKLHEDGFGYTNPSQVMLEIAETIPAFKQLNYDKIGMLGVAVRSS
jgi:NADH-quinone oxidoreductase subunit G